MNNRLPSLLLYYSVWVVVAAYAALCEAEVLPSGYVSANAQTQYALHMLCIVLTLGGAWGALHLLSPQRVMRFSKQRLSLRRQLSLLRGAILALAIFVNLLVYYALLSGSTPLFCLLITLAAYVFCYPKKNE